MAVNLPDTMQAMVFRPDTPGLTGMELPVPHPGVGQLLLKVSACGVCRTDLHIVDGELGEPKVPVVPGHQIVGTVIACGESVPGDWLGRRVGVPWLGGSCGHCDFCGSGQENLCDAAVYTGYQTDGGFAEYAVADADYCFAIPDGYADEQAAPLLCAGLIGYRAYRLALNIRGGTNHLGLYGFGAAAHILIQLAVSEGREVYAFTRPDDDAAREFARSLGAVWAGSSTEDPPRPLDSAIIFAPDGSLVPRALRAVRKGGRVVCAGIHMSDIPAFPYADLWGERSICSVANLTRRDGEEFLPLAAGIPVQTDVHVYPLARAWEALQALRAGDFTGAAVVLP